MHARDFRMLSVIAAGALALTLVACSPEDEPAPSPEPQPTATETPSPSPSEEPIELTIPRTCEELVDIDVVQAQFGSDFVAIEIDPMHPLGAEYRTRGGIACVWGIPQSDAGVFLAVARADVSNEEQVAEWQAEGYTQGPDFLDETWVLNEDTELGPQVTVGVLVEGFELSASTSGTGPDSLLVLVRNATENMGYV